MILSSYSSTIYLKLREIEIAFFFLVWNWLTKLNWRKNYILFIFFNHLLYISTGSWNWFYWYL